MRVANTLGVHRLGASGLMVMPPKMVSATADTNAVIGTPSRASSQVACQLLRDAHEFIQCRVGVSDDARMRHGGARIL